MSKSSPEATGPLKGLRVIELGVLLAGPFCGQLLGDLGAEVIKIEPPDQGDPMRDWGPIKPKGQGLWFPIVARNKKCIVANMRKPEGQQILKDLVADADFVLENFRPGTMEKWGIGYDTLSAINPGIIMIRVSGYGQTGPSSHKAGYASVGEAMGGLRYVMGEADRMPSRAGISIGDTLAATFATIGALAALEHRRKTGRGQMVDAAIYESCFAMMESLIPDFQFGNYIRERAGSILPKIAPSNIYPASDGMLIIAANQDTVWCRLAELMGRPELAHDPRYATHIARGEHQGELDELISAWTRTQTSQSLEDICEQGGVPCGRIYRAPEMLQDEHFAARQAIIEVEHPVLGGFKMQNVFPKLSETPGNVRWTGPDMGAHTLEVLQNILGYDDTKIEALKAVNAI
ncbi:CaiB/BaiF CoA transferase family protein [Candidatus Phycosocius spiralis]|uniref:Succinyl-CoA--D-citramalate CoA-transferase n=1 Tax=Candidatus Phycosocius spiralis TaxID=2815099 RepID=A0ABQ4PV02_9PROT|nr:CoA transferase [Candidatus Phycosocius spiralis]GIU66857.1 succinyl-CoA--D-citramalate CoA-transferase [Candidatus Phycosocius spiralis]